MYTADFSKLIEPWKDVKNILKPELKRTLLNISTAMVITLRNLTTKERAIVMKKHKAKLEKIESEVASVMDRLPHKFNTALFLVNPAFAIANITRDTVGKFDADTVEQVFKEYNLMDIKILGFPAGKFIHNNIVQKALKTGGFLTANQKLMQATDAELDDKAETKWWTPIERLFLFKNPFGSPDISEGNLNYHQRLINESKEEKEEYKSFLQMFSNSGAAEKFMQEVSIPYVESKEQLAEILITSLKNVLEDASLLAVANNITDFISVLENSDSVLGKINTSTLKKDVEANIASIKKDPELMKELVGDKEPTDELLLKVLYEKEFTNLRQDLVKNINDIIEKTQEELLGSSEDMEDIKKLKGTPPGDRLINLLEYSMNSLKEATSALATIEKNIK